MAKLPTTTPAPAPAPASATSAGPWTAPASESAQPAADAASGNGGGTASAESPAPVAESGTFAAPLTSGDQLPPLDPSTVPGMDGKGPQDVDVDNTHAQVERLADANISATAPTTEIPSSLRDQFTPSGVDVALEADRSPKPSLERSAYPSPMEYLAGVATTLDPVTAAKFDDYMAEAAEDFLANNKANEIADEITSNLVDGTQHYGAGVYAQADGNAVAVATTTNAERNRRARRAAERIQREAAARAAK